MRIRERLSRLEQRVPTRRGVLAFCPQSTGDFVDVSQCVFNHHAAGLDAPSFVRRYTRAEIVALGWTP